MGLQRPFDGLVYLQKCHMVGRQGQDKAAARAAKRMHQAEFDQALKDFGQVSFGHAQSAGYFARRQWLIRVLRQNNRRMQS